MTGFQTYWYDVTISVNSDFTSTVSVPLNVTLMTPCDYDNAFNFNYLHTSSIPTYFEVAYASGQVFAKSFNFAFDNYSTSLNASSSPASCGGL